MTKQNQLPRAIIAVSILSLIAGAAHAATPMAVTKSMVAQIAQADGERGHRHRHGTPGKGWIHDDRHSIPMERMNRNGSKRYGPPSTRLRSWVWRDLS